MWHRLSLISAGACSVKVDEDGLLANIHFSINRGLRLRLRWLAGVVEASFVGE